MTNKSVPSCSLFTSTSLLAAALSLVAGCAVDAEAPDVVDDPSSEQDSQQALASIIKIQADTDLALVLFREGVNGTWHRATRITGSRYQALVRGPYTVLAVCETESGPMTGVTSQTLQDPRLVELDCVYESDSFPFTVSGSVAQPGVATLGPVSRTSFAPNWTFNLAAAARSYDFIVAGSGHAIRRNLTVTGNTTVAPIDLVAQGTALVAAPFTVTNPLPDEVLTGYSNLYNASEERARIYRGAMPPMVAPASFLRAGDKQSINVDADVSTITATGQTSSYHDGGRFYQPGQAVAFTIWRPFVAVPQLSFDALGDDKVTWQTRDLQNNDGVAHLIFDALGAYAYHEISPSYLKQTKITSMTVPTHVPGYKEEWRMDRSDYTRNFVTARENPVTHERDGYGYADFVFPFFAGRGFAEPQQAQHAPPAADVRAAKLIAKYRVER